MERYDLKSFKNAKIYIKHIEAILLVINLAIRGLNIFKPYRSVQKILLVMTNEKQILEAHLSKCKRIIDAKGKVN